MKTTLVVMAAGMATRYGGNKQITGMGPNNEILLEYSIYDAIRAGFTKVVFIIRKEMLDTVRRLCGDRLSKKIEVSYAFQDFSSLPRSYTVPEGREKPFGTVHAVLCARDFVHEPFAVINADDYYGVESFKKMHDFLVSDCEPRRMAMIGYQLRNTVSIHGSVTRGLCRMDEKGRLVNVHEVQKIRLMQDGSIVDMSDELALPVKLDPEELVSMNFWGFSPKVFDLMDVAFKKFLERLGAEDLRSEYPLPVMVDKLIRKGEVSVDVLGTSAIWFGVTYQEDRPFVQEALGKLHAEGVYPEKLN
ncbi:MAG: hypothetical protein E7337_08535 [Clostridiales bacterium]|nr:hypothetical protein [Clostridiales bacterium]